MNSWSSSTSSLLYNHIGLTRLDRWGAGKPTARISTEHQRLSAFRSLSALMLRFAWYQQGGGAGKKRKVVDVRRKYEPLIYPDPDIWQYKLE
jgi:hypothetical protein